MTTTTPTLHSRHLLGIEDMSAAEIDLVLQTAFAMKEVGTRPIKKVPTLRGRTILNLFFEPSTRTRMSFELAEKRLSADTLGMTTTGSSVVKGETLADTARTLEAMSPDMIVIRHASSGAPQQLARICRASIINAGDGMHEHPTQGLLDAFTILERKGRLSGLKVAIVGDLLHSRVARSNLFGLRTMGARVRFVGPTTLVPPQFADLGAELVNDLHEGLRDADVIMMLRIQRERMNGRYFSSLDEYSRMYCLSADAVAKARKDVIILHPGPMNRGVEISSTVADGPYSVIMDQVTNGVAVRMAALYVLVGRRRGVESPGEDVTNEPVPLRRAAAAE